MPACRYQGPLQSGTYALPCCSVDQQRIRWVGSIVGNRIMKFISYMKHLRPKESHANSHKANTTTAKTHVTAREIPFKRRKQGTVLTQALFWALPHWQPSSASFHVPIFRAAVTPSTTRHSVLSFPSRFGYWLGSNLLFPIAQQKHIRIFQRELW